MEEEGQGHLQSTRGPPRRGQHELFTHTCSHLGPPTGGSPVPSQCKRHRSVWMLAFSERPLLGERSGGDCWRRQVRGWRAAWFVYLLFIFIFYYHHLLNSSAIHRQLQAISRVLSHPLAGRVGQQLPCRVLFTAGPWRK